MKLSIANIYRRYFPNPYEKFIFGIVMTLVSLPGLGVIFVHHDDVFPNMMDWLRDIAIAWGCVTGFLGLFFIFSGFQESSSPGTLTYRLTHLF